MLTVFAIHKCNNGSYGTNCSRPCSHHCQGSGIPQTCDHVTGACLQECQDGRVGEQCQYDKCSENCNGGSSMCSHPWGTCSLGCKPGYLGLHCLTECLEGTYGEDCREMCSPDCVDKKCYAENGTCVDGCIDGANVASICGPPCPYGKSARGVCLLCPAGKTGIRCEKDCDIGKYGAGCIQRCSPYCTKESCHAVNGTCKNGCIVNRVMPLCTDCHVGWYGVNCSKLCSKYCDDAGCDAVTGKCLTCVKGFQGDLCEERIDFVPMENYIAVVGFAGVIIVSCMGFSYFMGKA
ncbi:multiple epidermal growth factor-like domains 10 [Elysia marginata]|uniref:Multiple epidermal growth factor-like domains 10 n=1 Tax=Elysia marginata TaxID=1093978 RepID=A0AAV4I8C3_9GAST|nr:multiple epidermal growth factor-like domains 10 [Elysia marginata]